LRAPLTIAALRVRVELDKGAQLSELLNGNAAPPSLWINGTEAVLNVTGDCIFGGEQGMTFLHLTGGALHCGGKLSFERSAFLTGTGTVTSANASISGALAPGYADISRCCNRCFGNRPAIFSNEAGLLRLHGSPVTLEEAAQLYVKIRPTLWNMSDPYPPLASPEAGADYDALVFSGELHSNNATLRVRGSSGGEQPIQWTAVSLTSDFRIIYDAVANVTYFPLSCDEDWCSDCFRAFTDCTLDRTCPPSTSCLGSSSTGLSVLLQPEQCSAAAACPPCVNGECSALLFCVCQPGFAGTICAFEGDPLTACPGSASPCDGLGTCNNGTCSCDAGASLDGTGSCSLGGRSGETLSTAAIAGIAVGVTVAVAVVVVAVVGVTWRRRAHLKLQQERQVKLNHYSNDK